MTTKTTKKNKTTQTKTPTIAGECEHQVEVKKDKKKECETCAKEKKGREFASKKLNWAYLKPFHNTIDF